MSGRSRLIVIVNSITRSVKKPWSGAAQPDANTAKLRVLLKEFQKLNAADDAFVPKLEEIWTELEHHIEDEESQDLPDLEKALNSRPIRGSSDGDSESLAKRFERTKAFVPSRSHPSAGENPWFESAVGMLAAPIDRIADLFRKFPDDITDMQAPADRGAKDRGIDGRFDADASGEYTTIVIVKMLSM